MEQDGKAIRGKAGSIKKESGSKKVEKRTEQNIMQLYIQERHWRELRVLYIEHAHMCSQHWHGTDKPTLPYLTIDGMEQRTYIRTEGEQITKNIK